MSKFNYYIFWARYKRKDMYLLWREGLEEKDSFWTSDNQLVPAFRSSEKIVELAKKQHLSLNAEPPKLLDFDAVASWMDNPEKMPPAASLEAWNIFTDVSQSAGKPFDGDTKSPVRNRVFELLYVTAGIWRRPGHPWGPVVWPRQERKVLRRILLQGFRLWNKHVYDAD
ncbi:hypothetical protein ACFST9_07050 [Hymenobacter monticola]|uniref:Uncharacterized protein n=1 Tax=Hymenobacter monticola TaxID=1705399 RepID=A0ABY4B398_9BACT|nr:hypothetical protein [Hymenobacter monticola]UOE33618.1 hypothetical protein MTP16_21155 [Hymenobacter monticola]